MAASRFPVLRGEDAQQSRVQDNLQALVAPIAAALQKTPIMGAPPPSLIRPELLNGWTSNTPTVALISFHKDALGYVHVVGYGINTPGCAGFTVAFVLPIGYRPNDIHIFAVRGTAFSAQFAEIGPDGSVRTEVAVAAGGTCTFEFTFLAER